MKDERVYTLAEVMNLGLEACHVTEDGVTYVWTGAYAVRTEPANGVSVMITNPRKLPSQFWVRMKPE